MYATKLIRKGDLQRMFDCSELAEKEKVSWFFKNDSPLETWREILMRQPKTPGEAENAARLTQKVEQSLHGTQE